MKGSISMGSFPDIAKSISNYLYEEEGNITRNKLLMVGSMAVVMSVLFALEVDAGHGSHKSHNAHTSHQSGGHSSGHSNHGSHESHTSSSAHSNHGSSSHSNHSSSAASHHNTTHSSRHASHISRHQSSHHSASDHVSHSSHVSSLQAQQQTLPLVRVPQTINNTTLPSSVELSQLPQMPNVPDTVAPTFSVVETIVPPNEKE